MSDVIDVHDQVKTFGHVRALDHLELQVTVGLGRLNGAGTRGRRDSAARPPGVGARSLPLDHVPAYPATGVAIAPIVTLAAVGTLLTVIGLAGLRRRDVG
jgi:hypothetical protein